MNGRQDLSVHQVQAFSFRPGLTLAGQRELIGRLADVREQIADLKYQAYFFCARGNAWIEHLAWSSAGKDHFDSVTRAEADAAIFQLRSSLNLESFDHRKR